MFCLDSLFSIAECANLIRLQKLLNPNWRSVIVSTDSDEKIVNDFIKQVSDIFLFNYNIF